ncbi:XdhC family protein [Pseudomonas sp. SST3]|uniref:XdhC family protein n=1 Tax=Pseudomonas sp. SST3 TaxID=2267882 RepID=UPI000E006374|nr:XdhC/CoxI family protein [Pseudomonas sp. SST3]NKQ13471.1 XdhC family protein [Pseudomonas sp. SST3]
MSEIDSLLSSISSAQSEGYDLVMATVVKTEGSAYRRPGARMLIFPQGRTIGTVSGGCLESDVARKAWWMTSSTGRILRSYSTGDTEDDGDDAELTFGLGCNGTIHLILERISPGHVPLSVEMLQQAQLIRMPAAVATILNAPDLEIGATAALGPLGEFKSEINNAHFNLSIMKCLKETLQEQRSTLRPLVQEGIAREVFFEFIPAPVRLVIFGAGHDVPPLVRIAKTQGWHVSVIDSRPHFARRNAFPEADEVKCVQFQDADALEALVADAAVVVMTHSLKQDTYWLALALRYKAAYIGQLGPRSRTERLLADIDSALDNEDLKRLHSPVGLDLGGDNPASIALAITGEILAFCNRYNGKPMKDKDREWTALLG